MQNNSERWKLISYSIDKNKSTDLYDLTGGDLIHFDYSSKEDLIAVISIHNDGLYYIDMLKPDGRIISSHPIIRPQELPKFHNIYPSFEPLNNQLVFSTGKQLFTLSYNGRIEKINLPFSDDLMEPRFHPDGKRLVMIKRMIDNDIVLQPLSEIEQQADLSDSLTQTKQSRRHGLSVNSHSSMLYALMTPWA